MQGESGPAAAETTQPASEAPPAPPSIAPADEATADPFALATSAYSEVGGPAADAALSGETPAPTDAAPPPTEPEPPDELTRLREENEKLRAAQPQPTVAPEVAELRSFVGLDPIHPGGPSLADLQRAIDRRDYEGLYAMSRPDGSRGYTLEEAIDLKGQLEANRRIMDRATGMLHGAAWAAIGGAFDQVAQHVGLDPKALADEAGQAGNPLATTQVYLTRMVEAAEKGGRAEGVKEWKGKHDALRAEFDAFKAKAAGGAASLETGGRGNGKRSAKELLSLPDDEFVERALRGEFAGLDMRD